MTSPFDGVEVLIVEDNPNDAELIVRALGEQGLGEGVHVVEDGEEALDFLFCRGKYAARDPCRNMKAVFLDLKLPRVDGFQVLREVKGKDGTKKTPVVVFSSSREDRDIESAYELGANGYIVKAVDFNRFRADIAGAGVFWLTVNQPPKA
jgi:two-component system response regulator